MSAVINSALFIIDVWETPACRFMIAAKKAPI
jgi:hypothetical protein